MDILTLSLAVKKALKELGVEVKNNVAEVIPKTELVPHKSENESFPTPITIHELFEEGATYRVSMDSGVYTAICKKYVTDEVTLFILGNPERFGAGEDTGETFSVATFDAGGIMGMAFDYNDGEYITVYKKTETIHPIDQKYLPGVCLEMIELTSEIPINAKDIPPLTAEESAVLSTAAAKGLPVIIKFNLNGNATTMLCTLIDGMFIGYVHPMTFVAQPIDDALWMAQFQIIGAESASSESQEEDLTDG